MPKRFGHTVYAFATLAVVFSFTGCRTATSKMASVPGLGWLERGSDEGWAKYEPAPGSPRPSATSEPTDVGPSSSSIANNDVTKGSATRSYDGLASKSKLGGGPKFAGDKTSSERFDKSRYMPKDATPPKSDIAKAGAGKSGYSSAYGKYGPPKSLAESKVAPQAGPYDVDPPKFAAAASDSDSRFSNSKFGAGADLKQDTSGAFAGDRFGASPETSATSGSTIGASKFGSPAGKYASPSAVASKESNSRFGNKRFDNNLGSVASSQPFSASATPPATQPAKPDFGKTVGAAPAFNAPAFGKPGAQQLTNQFAKTATNAQATAATTAQNALGQTNSLGEAATSRFGAYATTAQDQLTAATNSTMDAAKSTFETAKADANRYAQGFQAAAQDSLNNGKAAVGTEFGKASQFAGNSFNQFSKDVAGTVSNAKNAAQTQVQGFAQQTQKSAEQAVSSTYGQAKSRFEQAASSTYQQAKNSIGQYANSGVETVKNGAAKFANSATQAVDQTVNNARQAVQNVSTPIQPAYPTTSNPNPFVIPGASITGASQRPRPQSQPAATQAPTNSPATNANEAGPIHRTATPFLPGSTKTFQGATTTRKPSVELASASAEILAKEHVAPADHLVLAVGDKYQFPQTLR